MGNWYNVYKEFKEFNPSRFQALVGAYHQIRYGNDWERVVFGRNTNVREAEECRYKWATLQIPAGSLLVDLGCGSGYGSRFTKGRYIGVDLDHKILEFAKRQYAKEDMYNIQFMNVSIQTFLKSYNHISNSQNTAIVAFEIIEHLDEGLVLAQDLRASGAGKVFLSVPYAEVPGRWGPHHKLHALTEDDFPGYEAFYLNMKTGKISTRKPSTNKVKDNYDYLMLLRYEATNDE